MKTITKTEFLSILDNCKEHFVAPEWGCFSEFDRISVIDVGFSLVNDGTLSIRDCSALAFEYRK